MLENFLAWVKGIDWWVVTAGLFLICAAVITVIDLTDGRDTLLFRNTVAWLNTTAVVCALFSIRDSLFGLRREQMRRAYVPDLRN